MANSKQRRYVTMPNKEKRTQICLSTLKERGWTDKLIDEYLPEPSLVPNPHYRSAANMRLWYLDEVEMVEKSNDEFQKNKEKKQKKDEEKQKKREEAKRKREEQISKFAEMLNVRNPAMDYPNARKLYRHFILHVGPTNTGKTYKALQALKSASSGVYLAPLRLLAMEVQDKLIDEGILCSMLTGEEENLIEGSTIMSSTVEKINLHEKYEIGIIDECQMIADDSRGGSWTRAILGLAAETIYLCMSPDAVDICIKLIDLCGDTYEIVECTRNTELIFKGNITRADIEKNDAVILFSRRRVLEVAKEIKEQFGLKPSVVYGALPYKARKQQVDLYNSGRTDIIVATDAIGMGMNLPIRRVVFAEDEKFDGVCLRPLLHSEIKQIAGRAGRFGMFDEGYVVGLKSISGIKAGLDIKYKPITKAYIPFPEEALSHNDDKLSSILSKWEEVKYPEMFVQQNISLMLDKVNYLEQYYPHFTKRDMLKLSMVMFDENNESLLMIWKKYVDLYNSGRPIWMPEVLSWCKDLQTNEYLYKELDLFYSFHKMMGLPFDYNDLMEKKELLIELINKCLLETNKAKKQRQAKKKKKKKHLEVELD